jgi:hypothetical protein
MRFELPSQHSFQTRSDFACQLALNGSIGAAAAIYRELLTQINPGESYADVIRFHLSWYELREGKIREGLRNRIESGRRIEYIHKGTHFYQKPYLTSDAPLSGKTVLLSCECGAGDEIIAARYARFLKRKGARVLWVSRRGLGSVLARTEGVDETFTPEQAASLDFDYWAFTLDLPLILGSNLDDIKTEAYVNAAPEFVEKWRKRTLTSQPLKVGLRWKGEPGLDRDQDRFVPFALLEKLCDIPGARAALA